MFLVVTPSADRNLLTPAQLHAAAGVDTDSTELTELGLSVSDNISRVCNVRADAVNPPTLLSEEIKQVFRGTCGQNVIILGRSNITEVTSVKIDGIALDVDTDIEFTVGGLLYLLREDHRVPWTGRKVEVEYTAGFAQVPSDIVQIASEYVRLAWSVKGRDPTKKAEWVEGAGRDEWFEGDAATVDGLVKRLAPYIQYGY